MASSAISTLTDINACTPTTKATPQDLSQHEQPPILETTTEPKKEPNVINSNVQQQTAGEQEPKEEEKSLPPKPILVHKIIVKSDDGKTSNMLCPLEIFNEAHNTSAPLIPASYDPQIFVSITHFKKSSKKKKNNASSRKRKNETNINRNAKRRKQSHHPTKNNHHSKHNKPNNFIPDDDEEEDIDLDHINDPNHKFFSFNRDLNVNSRPKRKRKKVSYMEPDSNIIPMRMPTRSVSAHKTVKKAKPSSLSNNNNNAINNSNANAYGNNKTLMKERIVEMKWVQCDKCMKWRRIPTYVAEKELEGQWFCKMNKWDLKRASCDADEEAYNETEETTVQVTTNGTHSNWGIKKNDFYNTLQNFYQSKQMMNKHLNINQFNNMKIGDKAIDFLQLYLEITKRGGYHQCITSKLFDQIFRCLECFDQDKVNEARKTLPNMYATYLMDYERNYFSVNQTV